MILVRADRRRAGNARHDDGDARVCERAVAELALRARAPAHRRAVREDGAGGRVADGDVLRALAAEIDELRSDEAGRVRAGELAVRVAAPAIDVVRRARDRARVR